MADTHASAPPPDAVPLEPAPDSPSAPAADSRASRGLRLMPAVVVRGWPWKRSKTSTSASASQPSPTTATRSWSGVGGAAFWSVQTLRTVLFLGCLAVTVVSAVALFQGLHQSRIAAIQDELPEVTELPHEQFQPSLAGTLPAAPPAALPTHHTTRAPLSHSPAPTLPVVVTAVLAMRPTASHRRRTLPRSPSQLRHPPGTHSAPCATTLLRSTSPTSPPDLAVPRSPIPDPPRSSPARRSRLAGGHRGRRGSPPAIIIRAGGSAPTAPDSRMARESSRQGFRVVPVGSSR